MVRTAGTTTHVFVALPGRASGRVRFNGALQHLQYLLGCRLLWVSYLLCTALHQGNVNILGNVLPSPFTMSSSHMEEGTSDICMLQNRGLIIFY